MYSLNDFINILSRYIPHRDLMIIQSGLNIVSAKFGRGEIDEKGVDIGTRKLCRRITAALGSKLSDAERDIGTSFYEWCTEAVKSIIYSSISHMSADSIISMFSKMEEEKESRSGEMGIL